MVGEPPDFEQLRSAMKGELRLDLDHRRQYAADESIYWIVPLAVAHPKDEADIAAVLRFAAENALGLTPRAGGTSLAGQAVGPGIILDISGRFDRVIEVDAAAHRVTAEPGVVLDALNGALAPHGQRFGPDPSSKDACQVGGMVANNASGVHHPMWGAVVDNVVSLRLMLANGEVVTTAPVRIGSEEHAAKGKGRTLEARIYRELPEIIAKYAAKMRKNWPRQEKSSSGYRLDKAVQGGVLDLSKLVCGSEGTLAIVLGATLATVDIPRAKGLLVLYFRGLEDAARGVSVALSTGPSAIEMIDERVVEALKAKAPELAARFKEDTRAALFVEYFGDDVEAVQHKMHAGWQALRGPGKLAIDDQATTDPGTMEELWKIRRGVEPLLSEMAGSRVPVGFVEDTAVPVEKLAEHVRGLYAIFDRYGLKAAAYGHASTGHLHVRPYLDLKDAGDRRLMERVAAEVFDQTRRLEGTMSGEHGDGLLRTEFLDSFFWETYDAMVAVKRLFDPVGILNPGKKVDGASGTMTKHLRALSERGG
jgi:FAD/FMN-containing dehydrogenase